MLMRGCNMCNAIFLVGLAIIVFLPSSGVPSVSESFATVTVAAYVCTLGLFICCAELNIGFVQSRCRTRFGFYYSYLGRAAVLFFAGTLAVALIGSDEAGSLWFYYIVGGATMVNAMWPPPIQAWCGVQTPCSRSNTKQSSARVTALITIASPENPEEALSSPTTAPVARSVTTEPESPRSQKAM